MGLLLGVVRGVGLRLLVAVRGLLSATGLAVPRLLLVALRGLRRLLLVRLGEAGLRRVLAVAGLPTGPRLSRARVRVGRGGAGRRLAVGRTVLGVWSVGRGLAHHVPWVCRLRWADRHVRPPGIEGHRERFSRSVPRRP
ncbi:hypothetical protein GCM10009799_18110 [Nocardiopsis rhodophaea]|uniref:Secreted protein n=1 Tax=Nocardiopsis rhodophaea TaxID=280238 RepID=A0ABP5E8E1_9ACTN